MPADEFACTILPMLRAVLHFDFGRLITAKMNSNTATVRGCIMFNTPEDNAPDWEKIQQQDVVASHVIAHPGRTLSFHAPSLFAGKRHALMRKYVEQYEHRNGLVLVLPDGDTGLLDGLSLYRARADDRFNRRDAQLLHFFMPHLQEALKLNRQFAVLGTHGTLLIASIDGAVQHCPPRAGESMLAEWPCWQPVRLPPTLLEVLRRPGHACYNGRHVDIECQSTNALLLLRVAPRSPLQCLSRREKQVAALYGKGLAAKVVAVELGITPTTARNTLQKIYQKLNVHDKAALAQLVLQSLD
jgi:DNA-binding CsgD family transcriptional regulator